jgi:hypothetical protein
VIAVVPDSDFEPAVDLRAIAFSVGVPASVLEREGRNALAAELEQKNTARSYIFWAVMGSRP